jgi:hypothetical protein
VLVAFRIVNLDLGLQNHRNCLGASADAALACTEIGENIEEVDSLGDSVVPEQIAQLLLVRNIGSRQRGRASKQDTAWQRLSQVLVATARPR